MKKIFLFLMCAAVCAAFSCSEKTDENSFKTLLHRAEKQGEASAQYRLGVLYFQGNGVKKDLKESMKWFRKAAEQQHAEAQTTIGACYSQGLGVEKDPKEAAKWFRKAAEQGYADAQYRLAICYEYGEGVEKNAREAAKWYRKAAENGHEEARKYIRKLQEKKKSAPAPTESAFMRTMPCVS